MTKNMKHQKTVKSVTTKQLVKRALKNGFKGKIINIIDKMFNLK